MAPAYDKVARYSDGNGKWPTSGVSDSGTDGRVEVNGCREFSDRYQPCKTCCKTLLPSLVTLGSVTR